MPLVAIAWTAPAKPAAAEKDKGTAAKLAPGQKVNINTASKEDLDKLFKTEADIRSIGKLSNKGAGVGLILSKELVERNGGRMYVESTVGGGSTFYFTLPEKKFA